MKGTSRRQGMSAGPMLNRSSMPISGRARNGVNPRTHLL
jgi:hypothetical protein